jgi:hypothetical protein
LSNFVFFQKSKPEFPEGTIGKSRLHHWFAKTSGAKFVSGSLHVQVEAVCQGRYWWLIVPWWMGAATTGDAEMPRFQEFCLEAVPRLIAFGETGPMRPM